MGNLFGTDGVRGVANTELTPEMAFNLGQAATFFLGGNSSARYLSLAVIPVSLAECWRRRCRLGFVRQVARRVNVGVVPTPAVALFSPQAWCSGRGSYFRFP